jgi:hypothetical protein
VAKNILLHAEGQTTETRIAFFLVSDEKPRKTPIVSQASERKLVGKHLFFQASETKRRKNCDFFQCLGKILGQNPILGQAGSQKPPFRLPFLDRNQALPGPNPILPHPAAQPRLGPNL